jgi:hypothetical protein
VVPETITKSPFYGLISIRQIHTHTHIIVVVVVVVVVVLFNINDVVKGETENAYRYLFRKFLDSGHVKNMLSPRHGSSSGCGWRRRPPIKESM